MSWASGPCYTGPPPDDDTDHWAESDQALCLCLCHLENDAPITTEDECPAHGPAEGTQ